MTTPACHPFQKLCCISQSGDIHLLLVATGPHILSLDLKNGGILSRWPNDAVQSAERRSLEELGNGIMDDDPPAKRRKPNLSKRQQDEQEDESRDSSTSVEFVSERAKGQRRKKKETVKAVLPNVSHIIATLDGLRVVATTAEDKCIRVFELDSSGQLTLLSERYMPKRLCAIALSKSQSTILAGDKFGDVYALPLQPSLEKATALPSKPQLQKPKPTKPSASELTVHTKGNLEALRQQKLQKGSASKKTAPTFEHRLILGHVSLLTDLVVGADPSNDSREYILTADRDEHIRVSRGIPQAHVINNYCLGHTEFVSKLCTVPELPQFLISGGGEPSLRIYDWLRGTCVAAASLEEDLKRLISNSAFNGLKSSSIRAVSCIQAMNVRGADDLGDVIMIVVAFEGIPGISTYLFHPEKCILKQDRQYIVDANVLDIVLLKESGLMLVSLDNVHSPLSTKEPTSHALAPAIRVFGPRLEQFDGKRQFGWVGYDPATGGHGTIQIGSFEDIASKLNETLQSNDVRHEIELPSATKPDALYSTLGEFLYGLENLRKKSQGDGQEQETEELAVTHPEGR
ncbi:hypothetical protein GJ744_007924 [Endocarpon pusillum]|uniref:Transfer RNA methyltransferase 82 n=1 Tax=Endocarpon pusillum TaxID=364733 RepID=A0A8H7ALE5_9EURO|nr:hypothetical protein GJ744_007924 [Endocarpon pusillum]